VLYVSLQRVLDSIHGGNSRKHETMTLLYQQDQLFTEAIKFPVVESNAWTEKVSFCTILPYVGPVSK
jgi:callose synthase